MDEIATYIGKKGYTIKKDNMEIEDQLEIRKDLMVKPFVPKSSPIKPKSFPVYRESQKILHTSFLWNKHIWRTRRDKIK